MGVGLRGGRGDAARAMNFKRRLFFRVFTAPSLLYIYIFFIFFVIIILVILVIIIIVVYYDS